MFEFVYDEFDAQVRRAVEALEYFQVKFEQNETAYALKKLNKLSSKIDRYEEDDFEDLVDKFFGIMKNWAFDTANALGDYSNVNKTMAYCNFDVIEVKSGSRVTDFAAYIGKQFNATKNPVGVVAETAYAYVCHYIYDDTSEFSKARTDVVVK